MGDAATNIAKAFELKEQGNEYFKAGDYKKAKVSYHSIFMYVHGFSEGSGKQSMPGQTTTPVTAEQMASIRELKVAHFSNLAMCHLKLGNVDKARDNCTKALQIDPANVKALFRRGKCYSQLGALDEAKADLEQVLRHQPDNRDALREMQTLRGRFASHKKKEQKRFAGFFDKLHAEAAADDTSAAAMDTAACPAAAAAASPAAIDAASPAASSAAPSAAAAPSPAAMAVEGGGGAASTSSASAEVDNNATNDDDDDDDIGEALGAPQSFEPRDVSMQR